MSSITQYADSEFEQYKMKEGEIRNPLTVAKQVLDLVPDDYTYKKQMITKFENISYTARYRAPEKQYKTVDDVYDGMMEPYLFTYDKTLGNELWFQKIVFYYTQTRFSQ